MTGAQGPAGPQGPIGPSQAISCTSVVLDAAGNVAPPNCAASQLSATGTNTAVGTIYLHGGSSYLLQAKLNIEVTGGAIGQLTCQLGWENLNTNYTFASVDQNSLIIDGTLNGYQAVMYFLGTASLPLNPAIGTPVGLDPEVVQCNVTSGTINFNNVQITATLVGSV